MDLQPSQPAGKVIAKRHEAESDVVERSVLDTKAVENTTAAWCTFQPVALNVFPALPSVSVRSHMPGICAMRSGLTPSYVMCSYTSSARTYTLCF